MKRNSKKSKFQGRCSRKSTTSAQQRKKLTSEQIEELRDKLHKAYGREPYDFQLEAIKAQIEGTDLLVHAATGAGKTTLAAGPHVWIPNGITLITTPLIQLAEEMVEIFTKEFGLNAISIHSKNGALSPRAVKDILDGKYQVILASPEMMQTRTFIDKLLRNQRFTRRIIALFIDEAHCISHWGAQFRKKYGTIGTLRAFLPASTPVVAVSATLTGRVRRDIQAKLHFSKANSNFIDIGNDRPNISLVVRACQNPMNTYSDLDFVIPDSVTCIEDIPKTWIYVDNIDDGAKIIRHLRQVLRERNPEMAGNIIRPYNARLSLPYREKAMQNFREGSIRILICTEAAGMGCNIPDIRVVIQWKLPRTLSNFIQRAGRAARGRDQEGLAVLLVEPTVYTTILAGDIEPARARKGKGKVAVEEKAVMKEWAITHGLKRGGSSGNDNVPTGKSPVVDACAADEGLLAFVQSVTCRRKIWAEIFESTHDPAPTVPCCDICSPSLLNRTRPSPPVKTTTKGKMLTKGIPFEPMRSRLEDWRDVVFERDHKYSPLDSTAILSDDDVLHLSSIGPLTADVLQSILSASWPWWGRYGTELTVHTRDIEVVFKPLPKPPRKSKRSANERSNTDNTSTKKPRTTAEVPQRSPTAAAQLPPPQSSLPAFTGATPPPTHSEPNTITARLSTPQGELVPSARYEPSYGHGHFTQSRNHFISGSLPQGAPFYPPQRGPATDSSHTRDSTLQGFAHGPPTATPQPWQPEWPPGGQYSMHQPWPWQAAQYYPVYYPAMPGWNTPQAPQSRPSSSTAHPPVDYGPAPQPQP